MGPVCKIVVGVTSPLLANSFLHWFDKAFHGPDGPAQSAKAQLIRYADDFVVMAKRINKPVTHWIEYVIETRLGLEINREKTSVVRLSKAGSSLDFLGYTFRYDRDLYGHSRRYLNRTPSKKSLQKAREKIRALTSHQRGCWPLGMVVSDLNQFLRGWRAYFCIGYPRKAYRDLDRYAMERMIKFLTCRSQRPFKLPEDKSWHQYLYGHLGVIQLCRKN